MRRHSIGLMVCLLLWPRTAAAQETGVASEIEPPDVFVRVELVRKELELIRFVMGRPENTQPEIGVSDAAPREVYFQAQTLFRKAERLCFEYTRQHIDEPALPAGEIRPTEVMRVVDATLSGLLLVKEKLGIDDRGDPPARDASKTPTDVFRTIVQANRQLNLLLEHRFAPSDVFQQITLGIGYASRLLDTFPDATTIPEAPEFETGKQPGDVYRRLLNCFERIRGIATASGLSMLELEVAESQIANAEPSDVYDVASLLVAELAFLHSQRDDADPPREVYYVGRKFPSHVFQRAGILERQLIELKKRVEAHPDWLVARADSS